MIFRCLIVLGLAILVAGCGGGKMLTSIPGGESKVFEAPPYEVKGKAQYDQNWIDSQVEGGVAAFGWPRPKPRPPGLDAAPAQKSATTPVTAKKAKKKSLIRKMVDHWRKSSPAVAQPPSKAAAWPDPSTTAAILPTPKAPVVAPPPRPRDPVDELLYPNK